MGGYTADSIAALRRPPIPRSSMPVNRGQKGSVRRGVRRGLHARRAPSPSYPTARIFHRVLILATAIVITAGVLSAVLAIDIVCLAMAPILVAGCAGRRLDPRPFLLALAAAANVGSAATLIGNPQNMLIGQVLRLPFAPYLLDAVVPAVIGLIVVWAVVRWSVAGHWRGEVVEAAVAEPAFDVWQSTKDLGVLAMLIAGGSMTIERALAGAGVDLRQPAGLFAASVVLSNLVSNVPAVMLRHG